MPLLINERDEVTEGAVSNLFLRLDGGWVTPPLSSGVLPGVGRRDFFLNVGATERADLQEGPEKGQRNLLDQCHYGDSVRGLVG